MKIISTFLSSMFCPGFHEKNLEKFYNLGKFALFSKAVCRYMVTYPFRLSLTLRLSYVRSIYVLCLPGSVNYRNFTLFFNFTLKCKFK